MTAHVVGLADVNTGSGMLVTGLAGLYLGRSLLRGIRTIPGALSAALLGTFAYEIVKNAALRVGFSTNDLKLITALLVIIALLLRRAKRTEDGEEVLV
jgi:putative ABC transport system permease protein